MKESRDPIGRKNSLQDDLKYMKNDKLHSILEQIGLSDKEASVYLSSLSLGPSTILALSRESDLKRPTVYTIVESLKSKGLMHIELKGLKQLYTAEHPEKLKNTLEIKKSMLAQALPEFESLFNLKGNDSVVKYYNGLEAVKGVYEMLLAETKSKENYWVISNTSKIMQLDAVFFKDFINRRSIENYNFRFLLTNTDDADSYTKQPKFNELIKLLPETTQFTSNITITSNLVVVHHVGPPTFALVIENTQIVTMLKEIFNLLWISLENKKEAV